MMRLSDGSTILTQYEPSSSTFQETGWLKEKPPLKLEKKPFGSGVRLGKGVEVEVGVMVGVEVGV
jgi:hypothetical protein